MSVLDGFADVLTRPRVGDWSATGSGRRFWCYDPRPGDFDINDIAHALAAVNRYCGHTLRPYSVAEHSVHVSYECCARYALDGLLHDASEAYLGDVCRPLKRSRGMEAYCVAERSMERALAKQFGLQPDVPLCVKRADEQLLATEARDLMPQEGPGGVQNWSLSHEPLPHLSVRRPWSSCAAKRRFLRRYRELTWSLTLWDRIVIRVREALGFRGCA